ncbi:hypothetical protein CJF32_00008322 [Rutstroemia sp. NJR-2017a WRK4]|nr:hypothetical protein CJF32_00008322 [Rutstroemia sp. NJR-2017a WRK4]
MTDHRVTDLVHGHLGQLSYDVNEQQWLFSKDPTKVRHFEQLLPYRQCIPPSIRNISSDGHIATHTASSQRTWLSKTRPETFPAATLAAHLAKDPSNTTFTRLNYGELLAIGGIVDRDHRSNSRISPIIAIPCGEAGHVLKLIKLQTERYGWDPQFGVRLSLMSAETSEEGHWSGTGGPILQVVSAGEGETLGTWFAVRQATMTTIFRPRYQKTPKRFRAPLQCSAAYPPSRVDANPVVVLEPHKDGTENHVDVSFNPWYVRQFAVVDQSGKWSSWDIEGRQTKHSSMAIVAGKTGNIYDGLDREPGSTTKMPGDVGEWHRILWAGSVSTIVVMNRRHLAVFDTTSEPRRLSSAAFSKATTNEWILDVKRSTMSPGHLFVLTTARLFWLDILPAQEDGVNADAGVNILLSHRHFRDSTDEAMKLTLSKDGEDSIMFISSSKNSLITSYVFSMTEGSPASFQASVKLSCKVDSIGPPQTECLTILPAAYVLPSELTDGIGLHYMQTGVHFYQAWVLTADLELTTTLWACDSTGGQKAIQNSIEAPTNKSLDQTPHTSTQKLHDDFIVSDVSDDDVFMDMATAEITNTPQAPMSNDLHLRINMRSIFERIFLKPTWEAHENLDMESTLGQASVQVQNGKQIGNLPLSTCLELSNMLAPSGDLDEAAKTVTEFIDYIHEEGRDDSPLRLHLSKLLSGSDIEIFDEEALQTYPDLLKIYDQLIDIWVTNLPHKTPGTARLKKAKQIQSISMELCLSSLGISLRNETIEPKALQHTEISLDHAPKDMDEISRASSPPFFSSQFHTQGTEELQFSLPTPERTPSLYSHTSAATTDIGGDPTLSRLRQYAVSIASETEVAPAKSSIITQWPSVPGTDPATYSWEEMQKAAASAASGDEDYRSRRERSRRRRRTEKFLNSERASEAPSSSQPVSHPFGSQPVAQNTYSSQPFNEVPMTQPDRGAFGGRPTSAATPGKKKPKKRRAAGF